MTSVQLAVVGAGPAGLAAAGDARALGADVLLIEERPALGGRAMVVPGARGLTEGLMRDLGPAEVWRNSSVWGVCGRTLYVVRGERADAVAAQAVLLAPGAREAMLPFPGWTLAGVTTVDAGWEAVRAGRVTPDAGPAVVVGAARAAALANRLHERGVAVIAVAPARPPGLADAVPYVAGALVAAHGGDVVAEIELSDGSRRPCALLSVESPRSPATELARLAACPCVYHPMLGGWVPRYDPFLMLHGPASKIFIAGDASGVDSPRAAAESGRLAARAALAALGVLPDADAKIAEARERLRAASIPLHARARESLMTGVFPDEVVDGWDARPGTVVCPCEGVTVDALRDAVGEGAQTPEDLRRMTRCGAGECGARRCEGAMLRWLAGALERPIGRFALPPMYPPARPVPIAALAALPHLDGG